jgi:hypothetical protein
MMSLTNLTVVELELGSLYLPYDEDEDDDDDNDGS